MQRQIRTTKMKVLVTLYNGRIPLSNIKKCSPSGAVRVLCMPLKGVIHQLTL